MPLSPCPRGVTLIEVLVAMLVFSLGLIGTAALLAMAARSDHVAYLRTQVTFLAQSMAERMRANLVGVWRGDYNGAYPDDSQADCAAGCTPRQLALYDRQRWSSQLKSLLPPGSRGGIQCDHHDLSLAPAHGHILIQPPYGGNCSMTITFIERGVLDAKAAQQTFAWEFEP